MVREMSAEAGNQAGGFIKTRVEDERAGEQAGERAGVALFWFIKTQWDATQGMTPREIIINCLSFIHWVFLIQTVSLKISI
jgi:hypothetical protein